MGKPKMLILPGNADLGDKYPDEKGNKKAWPNGALHAGAAETYARNKGYEPETVWLSGHPQGYDSPQTREVLKRFVGLTLKEEGSHKKHGSHQKHAASYVSDPSLKGDKDIHAFYGFSGGGYNLWWILQYLANHTPEDLRRIDRVVVIGVEKNIRSKADYDYPAYNAIARKIVRGWKEVRWTTVYHTNPPSNLLPANLPQNISTHMFGPDVLLAGKWPDET